MTEMARLDLDARHEHVVRQMHRERRVYRIEVSLFSAIPHAAILIWALYLLIEPDWFQRVQSMQGMYGMADPYVWGGSMLAVGVLHFLVYLRNGAVTRWLGRAAMSMMLFWWTFVLVSVIESTGGGNPTWVGFAVLMALTLAAMRREWNW